MKLRMPEMPPATLVAALGSYNLLPAIVFLPTRRRCDEAASEAALSRRSAGDDRREARRDFMRSFVEVYPEIRNHRHWDTIVRGGIASHHAGHMPAWKLVIEKMMSAGLLDAIFATATVAAGVDFPARSVVVTVADRRSNRGWESLTASELQQMTGRAGRRGKDRVGFIIAAPGPHQNPRKIAELLGDSPNDLESQFRATYTSLLNLLDAFGNFRQVREIAERSFAHRDAFKHRRDAARARIWGPFAERARVLDHFGYIDFARERVTERGRWLADLHVDYPLLAGEALERGLFTSLDMRRIAAMAAALAADEDRDYGQLELDDDVVDLLTKFEEIAFDVSNEEWKRGVEA